MPRFWQTERGQKRFGYTRDGTPHPAEARLIADLGLTQVAARPAADALPGVLTKTGFRAVAVIFDN